MALQATMQCRSYQVWNGRLLVGEAVLERQRFLPSEGDDHRFLGFAQG